MTESMTAAVIERFGAPDVFKIERIPRPTRLNDELLVEIHAAGVNQIDTTMRAGATAAVMNRLPAVLGYDFSGVVVEAPYESHPLRPGDAVYGVIPVPRYSGSYAEYATVPSLCIAPKPVGLSHAEAASVPHAALTAWGIVTTIAKAHERQRILIHAGASGVGHFAVQFAAYFGAHVIATASARNLEWLRALGARETLDSTAQGFEEALDHVDVVIEIRRDTDCDTGARSLRVLRPNGLVINAGAARWTTLVDDAAAAGVRATSFHAAPDGATLAVISRLLEQGSVRPHVEEVFTLTDAAAAHTRLEAGHVRGKLVLSPRMHS